MKREGKLKTAIVFSMIIGVIFLTSLVSAGWFDWIKTLTGKATSGETNVSVTIAGVTPVSVIVHNSTLFGGEVTPTEESSADITFKVTITDPDGANDINTSSVFAYFTKSDEATRSNITGCLEEAGESTSTSKNFTCTVVMWYFDAPGLWNINVTANDLGNKTVNSSNLKTFSYEQLQAIKMFPEDIYWGTVSIGAENQTAANHTIINNTGNYNITGNLEVNATNLYYETSFLDVGNVSIGIDTGSECNGTVMENAENTGISGFVLERGNLSSGDANSNIYYCFTTIPSSIPSGTYDTTTEGSWTIRIV